MTEKQFAKYVGKKIRVRMHIFPYSVVTIESIGILLCEEKFYQIIKNGERKWISKLEFIISPTYDGSDYLVPPDGKRIKWNEVKLIISVEVLE